ncbi:Ras family protein [Entamoeba histolytica HM-3:IMSS]|uniref:Rab family GTPase n=6 Tax=Entamoeba histolytica TaxID=5759 RepID=A0A8U0WNZ1_ENTH1|eukprot:XP_654231.1 Rab family GTPase [Entamoeba histolytica HM-1:IMSS]
MEATTNTQSDYTFKILIIGESGVGKTAILERYCENIFNESLLSTVGVDFKSKYFTIEGKRIKVQLWDTAGQEKFRNITTSYYRGTHGCIVTYDVTDINSFDKITYWLHELGNEKYQPEIIILGNKIDARDRKVTKEMAENFSRQNGGIKVFNCSAKTGEGVEEVFTEIVKSIFKNKSIMGRMRTNTGMRMEEVQEKQKEKECC